MTHTEIRNLPCALTQKERDMCGDRLAELIERQEETKKKRSAAVSGYNEEIKEIGLQIREVSRQIMTKTEVREVECEFRKDLDRKVLEVIRLDTSEVVDSRKLKEAELQDDLPLAGPASTNGSSPPKSPKTRGRKAAVAAAPLDA